MTGSADIYQFTNLSQQLNLVHGVATAQLGNMSFKFGPAGQVKDHRNRFFAKLGVPADNVVVTQLVHEQAILEVTERDRGKGAVDTANLLTGDILVTSKPDTYLFFVVADCLALFLFDPVKQVCALAHAGWRGVELQVPGLVVNYLVARYGSNPKDLLIGLSPALQRTSACFTNNHPEYANRVAHHPTWQRYATKIGEKTCVDITQYAYDQLIQAGVPTSNIERSTIDTRRDPNFFSHRRSQEDGQPEQRFGCLIGFTAH